MPVDARPHRPVWWTPEVKHEPPRQSPPSERRVMTGAAATLAATPPLLDGSGAFGLHSTNWKAVRTALRKLGGSIVRGITNNHDSLLMVMEGGRRITVGTAKDTNAQILTVAINQLMREVIAADLEPALFLAVLERQGCAWNNKPTIVTHLDAHLRLKNPALHTTAARARAIAEFERARYLATVGDASVEQPEPIAEPPAPAQAGAYKPPDPIEKQPEHQHTHPFTTTAILDLVGLKGRLRDRASWHLAGGMKRPHEARYEFIRGLLDSGEALRLSNGGKTGKRTKLRYVFSERAAEQLAAHLLERYPIPNTSPPEATMQDTPTQPATANQTEPSPPPPPPPGLTLGSAILRLCDAHGIDAVFADADGLTIDLHGTIYALGASAGKARA